MRTNVVSPIVPVHTHEGARAVDHLSPAAQLRRTVMSCMLFEDTFYESGVEIATRMHDEAEALLKTAQGADVLANLAYEARTRFKLRHAPLWLLLALIRHGADARQVVAGAIASVVQRPDEMAELLAMYWKEGKKPLTAQMKKGLAAAFQKFDRYSLSRYANRPGQVKMRDVLFLVHAKPLNDDQAALWKELAEGTLTAPDTWEAALSAGAEKKATFTRLMAEDKLGALALLRNLRGMKEAGVAIGDIKAAIQRMKTDRVLPFRFITAARYAPELEPELEAAMFRCLEAMPKLKGTTVLVVDNSGSMYGSPVSFKSELDRADAAAAVAMLLREICETCYVVVYSEQPVVVPPRRGFALRDVIRNATPHGGTDTGFALNAVNAAAPYDRCIVITDEQSSTAIPNPQSGAKGYFINVATYQHGIGYKAWTHIDGFSEAVVDYIQQTEAVSVAVQ